MTKKIDYKKWHSGPPPSVGWWPASASFLPEKGYLRWFNGEEWSAPATPDESSKNAAIAARNFCRRVDEVKWQHRPASWPKRSRT